MGLAAHEGFITLDPAMAWMGTLPAIFAFAVALGLEILVYYIPGVANLMDALELPIATAAGVVLTAAVTGEMDPFLHWSLAFIAGGTVAGGTEILTSLARLASTAVAGPVGTVAVSSTELASSTVLSILALTVPVLVVVLVLVLAGLLVRRLRRRRWQWQLRDRQT